MARAALSARPGAWEPDRAWASGGGSFPAAASRAASPALAPDSRRPAVSLPRRLSSPAAAPAAGRSPPRAPAEGGTGGSLSGGRRKEPGAWGARSLT